MKKHIGSFNKHIHSSNHLKLKSILSIFSIGLFIFSGFATIDDGDPENKAVICEFLHTPVAVAQKCNFEFYDINGNPVGGANVNFTISEYEKVEDTDGSHGTPCYLALKNSYNKVLNFGSSGKASFTLNKIYVSDDDEIQIFFLTSTPGYYEFPITYRLSKSDGANKLYRIKLNKIDPFP